VTFRLAHLSDIHFGGELPDAVEGALGAVAEFAPTVTVVTGDLTLNGLPREFRSARAWLDRLPHPIVVTPGNHDTPYWNLPLRSLAPFNRYRRYVGEPGAASFNAPGLAVRAVNSARGAQPRLNWAKGALTISHLQQIDWGADAETTKVFACHHPLIDLQGAPVTGGVHRGDRAARVLADAGVNLILTGHVHVPFAIALPGRGRQTCYAIGAGTLSVRTRGAPPSFSAIVRSENEFVVTVLAWADGRFKPLNVWRLPRFSTDSSQGNAQPVPSSDEPPTN